MADRLRTLRVARVLTQEQLAVKAGISSATVGRIEAGQLTPRFITIQRLAAALGVEPQELAGD